MSDSPIERRLLALGATPREIALARERRVLGLLAAVHEVLPAEAKHSSRELAGVVGVDEDVARRLWRAMGFADPAEGERPFTDADAEVLAIAAGFLASGTTTIEESVQMTRVIASSMARIAEAMVPSSPTSGGRDTSAEADELFAQAAGPTFDTYSKLLDYVWRRHLQAVLRRRLLNELEPDAHGGVYAVGFADLVGFTAMSQQLEPAELAGVVTRFEDLAFDRVTRGGGRVAKVIGDEVMFVVGDTGAAVDMGISLAEAYADDEVLSDVRVGVACGDVLAHEGDYYGPVVNLASRIVNIAYPGSVVVAPAVHERLDDDRRFEFHPLRARHLKDIGRVRLFRARRAAR